MISVRGRFVWMAIYVSLACVNSFAGNGQIVRAEKPIKDEYLILLDYSIPQHQVAATAASITQRHGGRVRRVLSSAVNGFSASMTEQQATAAARHPAVLLVEENGYLELSVDRAVSPTHWNLDRVDQRPPVTQASGLFEYCEDGSSGIAYVVDSGVRADHVEFRVGTVYTRVLQGACMEPGCVNEGRNPCFNQTPTLNGGHGTAVASIIAGNNVGVAPGAHVVPVQVVNCAGTLTTEWVATGLDWIRSTANPHRNVRPAVVNMSLFQAYITNYPCANEVAGQPGRYVTTETSCTNDSDDDCDGFVDAADSDCGGTCAPGSQHVGCLGRFLEHAVNGIVVSNYNPGAPSWQGIPVIVSANNHGTRWHHTTPARLAWSNGANYGSPGRVISVGGTDRGDGRWQCPETSAETPCPTIRWSDNSFNPIGSNFGPMVDIFAPAHDIESAHISAFNAYRPSFRSGTSFATPLVSGVALRLMQAESWLTTPLQVWERIRDSATLAANPIDPVTGNRRIIYRDGSFCP